MKMHMLFGFSLLLAFPVLLLGLSGCGSDGKGCQDQDGDAYFAQEGCGTTQDCDDTNPNAHPLAIEGPYLDPSCEDAVDNDCDGDVDENDSGCFACVDEDGDGYGALPSDFCTFPFWDCDDTNPNVNPGELEIPDNGIDEDCNLLTPTWPTPASTVGPGHSMLSAVVNVLLFALVPVGILLVLKRTRRKG